MRPLFFFFKYILNIAVVPCLIDPNTYRSLFANLESILYAVICWNMSDKIREKTWSSPLPKVIQRCLADRIVPSYWKFLATWKKTMSEMTRCVFPCTIIMQCKTKAWICRDEFIKYYIELTCTSFMFSKLLMRGKNRSEMYEA